MTFPQSIGNLALFGLMGVEGLLLALTQLFLRRFMIYLSHLEGNIVDQFLSALNSPPLWLAILAFLLAGTLWLWLLPRVELSTVYPMISLSYVAMLFFAHFWEGEPIYWTNIIGVILIMSGVALLAFNR